MPIKECSLYSFTVGGVKHKTTPKDVTARSDIASLKQRVGALESSAVCIETLSAAATGTTSCSFTLSNAMKNYSARTIVATCNGGSNGGRYIVSAIPSSSTKVTVNWSGNLPSTGSVFVTFVYQVA